MQRVRIDAAVVTVCVASVAVYAWPLLDPSREWQFVMIWDDYENFIENDVYKGLSFNHLVNILTLVIINVWEPLGWLLKALVYTTVGLNSRAFRIVTLVLHLGAGSFFAWTGALVLAIMYGGISLTCHVQQSSAPSNAMLRYVDPQRHLHGCLLATLLVYVVHPINVEIVAWPSAQPYALAALFSAASLFFHSRRLHRVLFDYLQVQSPQAARGASPESESMPSDWERLVSLVAPSIRDRETQLSGACFFAAVVSKSVSILLPVAIVLIDLLVVLPVGLAIHSRSGYLPRLPQCGRLGIKYFASKSLFVISAAVFVVITLLANEEGASEHADIITLSLWERIIKALSSPAWVLRSLLWPVSLRPHYRIRDDEVSLLSNPEYLLSIVGLSVLVHHLTSLQTAFRIPLLLATTYFCFMLLPTCGLIQHGIVTKGADRYAYFSIAVFIPIVGHWLARFLRLNAPSAEGSDHVSSARMVATPTLTRGTHKVDTHEVLSIHPGPIRPRLVFIAVLAAFLIIDANQMQVWLNTDTFIHYSLRVDQADSRLLHTAYNYKLNWGDGCEGPNKQLCTNWLNLSYYYAPTRSQKAKLYRFMIMILLDRKELACEGYKLMAEEYPDSAAVENNLAICAFLGRRIEETREHIQRAHTKKMHLDHIRHSITENYFNLMNWIEITTQSNADPPFFNAKIVW